MAEKDSRDEQQDALSSGTPPADATPAVAPPPEPEPDVEAPQFLAAPATVTDVEFAASPAEPEPAPLTAAIEAIAEAILPEPVSAAEPPPAADPIPLRPEISLPFPSRTEVTFVSLPTILPAATAEEPERVQDTPTEPASLTLASAAEVSSTEASVEQPPAPPIFIPEAPAEPVFAAASSTYSPSYPPPERLEEQNTFINELNAVDPDWRSPPLLQAAQPTLSIAPETAFASPPQVTTPIEEKNWRDRLFDRSTLKARAWKAARVTAKAAAIYLALILLLIPVFRFIDPPGSTYMLGKILTLNSVNRTWAPLSEISPNLVRAVIVSEDGRFCEHSGVDFEAVQEALEQSDGGIPRGASTISMQVTKNLFLWSSRSILRKIIEVPLTFILELFWPKSRIIEVYLNIAEWGDGVFGAEAAAREHFGKSAANLTEREAALLAAVLPNPLTRDAGSPNSHTSRKARVVQARVRAYGSVASCVVANQPQVDAATPAEKAKQKVRQRLAPRRDTPRRENGVPGPFFQ